MSILKNRLIAVLWLVQISCLVGSDLRTSYFINTVPKEHEDETLISGKTSIGAFGAPVIKLCEINDDFAALIGGCGGLILNHAFVIGGGGYGLANDIEVDDLYPYGRQFLEFGYGGLLLGYVHRSHKIVHLSVHSLIGGGGLSYRPDYYYDWYNDAFFILEPGIDLEINVTRYFRMAIGGTYLFVRGVDTYDLDDDDLSSPTASLSFKFGMF